MYTHRSYLLTLLLTGGFLAGAASADEGEGDKPGSKDVQTQCVEVAGAFTGFDVDQSCKMALSEHRSSEYPQVAFVCDPEDVDSCSACNVDEEGNPMAITGKAKGTITLIDAEEEVEPIAFVGKVFCASTLNDLALNTEIEDDGDWAQLFTARTMLMMNVGEGDRDLQPEGSVDNPKPDVGLFFADVGLKLESEPYLIQSMELTGVRRSPNSIKGTLELSGNFFGDSEAGISGTVCGVGLHDAILRLTGVKEGEHIYDKPDNDEDDSSDDAEAVGE